MSLDDKTAAVFPWSPSSAGTATIHDFRGSLPTISLCTKSSGRPLGLIGSVRAVSAGLAVMAVDGPREGASGRGGPE